MTRGMVPWPLALLTLFYAVIATSSAVTIVRIITGASHRAFAWAAMWLVLSAGSMCGLALLRPWARTVAMWTSGSLIVSTLSVASLLVAGGRPLAGLLVSLSAGFHVLVIRYLQRPAVCSYFNGDAERGVRSSEYESHVPDR